MFMHSLDCSHVLFEYMYNYLMFSLSIAQCFEGMKAYHGVDGKIRMFRPMENMRRMNISAEAASLPVRREREKRSLCVCLGERCTCDWYKIEHDSAREGNTTTLYRQSMH